MGQAVPYPNGGGGAARLRRVLAAVAFGLGLGAGSALALLLAPSRDDRSPTPDPPRILAVAPVLAAAPPATLPVAPVLGSAPAPGGATGPGSAPVAELVGLPDRLPDAAPPLETARVLVQVPPSLPSDTLDLAVLALEAAGFGSVQGARPNLSIAQTHARYFHKGDGALAAAAAASLGLAEVEVRDFTHLSPVPQRGTVEIWLAGMASPAAPRAGRGDLASGPSTTPAAGVSLPAPLRELGAALGRLVAGGGAPAVLRAPGDGPELRGTLATRDRASSPTGRAARGSDDGPSPGGGRSRGSSGGRPGDDAASENRGSGASGGRGSDAGGDRGRSGGRADDDRRGGDRGGRGNDDDDDDDDDDDGGSGRGRRGGSDDDD
jgi:hypothetical protein